MKDLTIIFDLDGTLIDTAPDLLRTLNHVLASIDCPPASPEDVTKLVGQGAKRMLERGLALANRTVDAQQMEQMFQQFLDHYSANIAVDSRPFPNVEAVLSDLRDQGARFGVCTNKLEHLSVKLLQQLKLDHYFEAIVGADTLGVRKPDPAHITGTIERVGGVRERAIMVGDSINDIKAAKAANVPVIGVSFGYTDQPIETLNPDVIIDHYDALSEAIEGQLARF